MSNQDDSHDWNCWVEQVKNYLLGRTPHEPYKVVYRYWSNVRHAFKQGKEASEVADWLINVIQNSRDDQI